MKKKWNSRVLIGLVILFFFRLGLSLSTYNRDVNNHIAWIDSVNISGWKGIYTRDLSPYALVNYPPLTLYSFWLSEKLYQLLPTTIQTEAVHASTYKIPSLIADCLIAYLIWVFLPFSLRWKLISMFAYLFNPALIINSVYWGQIESLSALTAIATILALVNKRGELAILAFTLGLLTKQNILPLTPLLLIGIYLTHTSLKKLFYATTVSLGLIFLSYSIFIPLGPHPFFYILDLYISSIGGQAHQHLSSVNALNFWYLLGQNKLPDTATRIIGIFLTFLGTLIGIYWLFRSRKRPYFGYWIAAIIISLWTFVFATRMHERHSYMAVAYLSFLLPHQNWKWLYLVVTGISFYNTLGVWLEYFAVPPSSTWMYIMTVLSCLAVFTALIAVFLPSKFFHQDRIKP